MLSLLIGQQFLLPLAGTPLGDGLTSVVEKARKLLPRPMLDQLGNLGETLMVKSLIQHDYAAHRETIETVNRAIADREVLKARYWAASQDKVNEWLFCPYGLVLYHTSLYCVGRVDEHQDIRVLKLSRFRSVKPTGRSFQRPAGFSLRDYLQGAFGVFAPGQVQTIRAAFTGWAATNVREQQWHPSQKIVEDEKDRVVAQFKLSSTVEFKRWLLGFGRHARVLQPDDLARDIAEELAAACSACGVSLPVTPSANGARLTTGL